MESKESGWSSHEEFKFESGNVALPEIELDGLINSVMAVKGDSLLISLNNSSSNHQNSSINEIEDYYFNSNRSSSLKNNDAAPEDDHLQSSSSQNILPDNASMIKALKKPTKAKSLFQIHSIYNSIDESIIEED